MRSTSIPFSTGGSRRAHGGHCLVCACETQCKYQFGGGELNIVSGYQLGGKCSVTSTGTGPEGAYAWKSSPCIWIRSGLYCCITRRIAVRICGHNCSCALPVISPSH